MYEGTKKGKKEWYFFAKAIERVGNKEGEKGRADSFSTRKYPNKLIKSLISYFLLPK